MPDEPKVEDELSPATKDPSEGARGPADGGEPAKDPKAVPGHLGPGGDPVEGK